MTAPIERIRERFDNTNPIIVILAMQRVILIGFGVLAWVVLT